MSTTAPGWGPRARAGSGPGATLPARVSVIGLGLMGGSLVRALSTLERPPRLMGWSPRPEEARAAFEAGALHEVAGDAEEAAAAGDLVVYATPLSAALGLLERHRGCWKDDALVTDLASLKAPVLEAVERLAIADRWVGSHPMAGGEGAGFAASREDLYRGARVWLVEGSGGEAARGALEGFWGALGARPRALAAQEHDRLMVAVSHLPQLASNALAVELGRGGASPAELGPGGRDMTRLAASPPAMWRELVSHSAPLLGEALRGLASTLREMADDLEAGDLEAVAGLMEESRGWATSGNGPGEGASDGPGAVGEVER